MTNPTATAAELIEAIQVRYHDGHRQAFGALRALAVDLPAEARDLDTALSRLFDALEQHMFKEEMRLFPMMVQGGNRLIAHLIDDLHAEHDDHGAAMQALCLQVQRRARACPAAAALQPGLQALAAELARHIQAEEVLLFPLFLPPAGKAPDPAATETPP